MAVTWKKLAYEADVVKHSLATAANDLLVASGSGVFVKKTLAETQEILGIGIPGSAVATSLDYLLKNVASIEPGHKHSKLWASDGSPEAVTVDAAGNVGIGTASPSRILHIYKDVNGVNVFRVENLASGTAALVGFDCFIDSATIVGVFRQMSESYTTSGRYIAGSLLIEGQGSGGITFNAFHASGPIRFMQQSVERMRINNDGNVGIGTTSPVISGSGRLHMAADTFRLDTARTPASAGAAGNAGDICWDSGFIYVAVGLNTWKRVALSSW